MIITDIEKLREKSDKVTLTKDNLTNLRFVHQVLDLLAEELKRHPSGIGLSAIQIGMPKRIAIIRTKVRGKLIVVNLVGSNITVKYGLCKGIEGCLSLPEKEVNVERYYHIQLDNREWYHGIVARAIQHELDHWEGILIIDKETK